jgi:hypothetical protein
MITSYFPTPGFRLNCTSIEYKIAIFNNYFFYSPLAPFFPWVLLDLFFVKLCASAPLRDSFFNLHLTATNHL